MDLSTASSEQLQQWHRELQQEFKAFAQQNLNLDLTRGKPSTEQLNLADRLDGILAGNYSSGDGTDTRNYGGLDGIAEARKLGADILGLAPEQVLAQGNSSLTLMFHTVMIGMQFGLQGKGTAWKQQGPVKFICPVPGYDRHFTICEQWGIEMITVPMTPNGPEMDMVEDLIRDDPAIKGMWCVPKYSNPTGAIYSEDTVLRIAKLGSIAGEGFRVLWDNAYAVHDLNEPKTLANIMTFCEEFGTEDSVIQFASTSKITHAGSGVAFIGASTKNLTALKSVMGTFTIGPDKVNQLRHLRLLPDYSALQRHMQQHAEILKPRFDCVLQHLDRGFGDNDLGHWQAVDGGYFISFDSRPGLAKNIVKLANELGVKLTPAGATYPYGKDPEDRNIRIAPSVPSLEQVDKAMAVFVLCVKLASLNQALGN